MFTDPMDPPLAANQTLIAVLARLGADVAGPLTAALARVQTMASSGRIDRHGLKALAEEIEAARRNGMRAQQLARLAAGQVQPLIERLSLTALMQALLAERQGASAQAAGALDTAPPLMVMGDASLIASLLRATADWADASAAAPADWHLGLLGSPAHAALTCRVTHAVAEQDPALAGLVASDGPQHRPDLDALPWRLLQFTAQLADVSLQREDTAHHSQLTLHFAHTVVGQAGPQAQAAPTPPLLMAGSQLLVLGARREARQLVRDALRRHELFIDYVPSVALAADYCADGAPQVLLFESAFSSEALRQLLDRLLQQQPGLRVIELLPGAHNPDITQLGTASVHRLGIPQLGEQLTALLALRR